MLHPGKLVLVVLRAAAVLAPLVLASAAAAAAAALFLLSAMPRSFIVRDQPPARRIGNRQFGTRPLVAKLVGGMPWRSTTG